LISLSCGETDFTFFNMPKAERGTPKDIANRIKMKGLQKLKFYCQMCEKQCRDANGFKCHLTSESHLRQMKIFSDNAGGILDQYSKDFERTFVQTLRMRHGTKKVNANTIYQEVIQDKQHIHMNSTNWTTLTDFVQYLGKTGKCKVEETERGWDIEYIERDVSILARKEALQRREQSERVAEEAQARRMEIQRVEAAKALDRAGGTVNTRATAMQRTEDDKPVKVALSSSIGAIKKGFKSKNKSAALVFGEDDGDDSRGEEEQPQMRVPALPPPSSVRLFKNDDKTSSHKRRKEQAVAIAKRTKRRENDRNDYWLYRDILVRVVTKKFDRKYFKCKAAVNKVVDKYTAEVEILEGDNQDILRLDQDDLDTVIPKETGKRVRILNGRYRGEKATVLDLNKKQYKGVLKLKDGEVLENVPYEDFSKTA
jgi:DNA/RNA-binding protein KIN17